VADDWRTARWWDQNMFYGVNILHTSYLQGGTGNGITIVNIHNKMQYRVSYRESEYPVQETRRRVRERAIYSGQRLLRASLERNIV